MAQVSRVIKGDPNTLASELTALAATEQIQIITKTKSAGSFIVVSDDTVGTGQSIVVVSGDPQKLSDEITAIIALPAMVEIVSETFSAAHYIVVYV